MTANWLRKVFGGKNARSTEPSAGTFRGYGGRVEDPVLCGGSAQGEVAYLKRLRCPSDSEVRFSRIGSFMAGSGRMVDGYVVECLCGEHRITVYTDMYVKDKDRAIAAPGWTLAPEPADSRAEGNNGGEAPPPTSGDGFAKSARNSPQVAEFMRDSLSKFGDDPAPKIVQLLEAEGLSGEAQIMGAIWFSYIGEPAIPHLLKLFGHERRDLAVFAAKALAGIEGSLDHIKPALASEDPKKRLHAAGSAQYFDPPAVQLIPDLCGLIEREAAEHGDAEVGKMSEAAGAAAGALGKMGQAAIPMLGGLLKHDSPNVRLAAVAALWRIGKPALPLLRQSEAEEKVALVLAGIRRAVSQIEAQR